jgi:translation initiation factor IF-1
MVGSAKIPHLPVPALICKASVLNNHRFDFSLFGQEFQLFNIHIADANESDFPGFVELFDDTPYLPILLSQTLKIIGTMQEVGIQIIRMKIIQRTLKGLFHLCGKVSRRIIGYSMIMPTGRSEFALDKQFVTAAFDDSINKIEDLESGIVLEGCVTNVANFGAFVDIGVHQDGLVHISEISNKFVKDIKGHLSVGDIVKVKVLDIDVERQRISLSIKQLEK